MSEETVSGPNNQDLDWDIKNLNLGERFDDLIFDFVGGSFPFQASGHYMGEPFYFRYRWSEASLSLGVEKDNIYFYPKYKARAFHQESADGSLTLKEFEKLFTSLLYSVLRHKG